MRAAWLGGVLFLVALSALACAEDKIILPEQPNGKLLIFAHGYRPEGFPNPAILELGAAYQEFSHAGWILATTSYPKAGMVVAEGAADVDRLRDEIEKQHGPIKFCLLHGESMGGTIVTLLAQQDSQRYQGVLAVGAALDLLPKGAELHGPRVPLLFLSNQTETSGPQAYVERFQTGKTPLALWKVARDGHVNVREAEVLAALEAVEAATTGTILKNGDGTVSLPLHPSTAIFNESGLNVGIYGIDPVYGNFMVSALEVDLEKLGYRRGDSIQIEYAGQTRKVFYGKEYSDVPEGDWVAFPTADGDIRISKNFRNAAKDLGIKEKTRLTIQKKPN